MPVLLLKMICWNCNNATGGEHFCPQCGKIQPLGPGEDYFSFFGYSNRQLNIDNADLERKFYSFSRQFHPDFFQQSSDLEKEASLEKSSPSMFCIGTIERRSWDRWRQYRAASCKIVQWRTTADEDGHYSFAMAL